jgi:hypothetical protein
MWQMEPAARSHARAAIDRTHKGLSPKNPTSLAGNRLQVGKLSGWGNKHRYRMIVAEFLRAAKCNIRLGFTVAFVISRERPLQRLATEIISDVFNSLQVFSLQVFALTVAAGLFFQCLTYIPTPPAPPG